jgi:hypothetical protein
VDAQDRGTSKNKQGIHCQSKEGINMTFGISMGVSVMEDDAPRYLYRWGIAQDPKADQNNPQVQFQSVLHARSTQSIMDDVVFRKVQTLLCSEVSKRTFEKVNSELGTIMATTEDQSSKYLKSVGVTQDFIGWADTVNFDHEIQKAVNDSYRARILKPYLQTLERLAILETKQKWDGRLPWWMPQGLEDLFNSILGRPNGAEKASNKPAPAPAK